MIVEDNIHKIFSINIFKTKVEGNNHLKDLLVDKITKNSDYLEKPRYWTTNKVKTSFAGEPKGMEILYNGSPYQKTLLEHYSACMDKVFDKKYEVLIPELWYNFYNNGEYQEAHDHLGTPLSPCHFSCIHFLSFDEKQHYPPQFMDPLAQLRNLSLELDRSEYGDVYIPSIEEGDLLMFPSYLSHCVPPCSKTKIPRITISFNVVVTNYGENNDRDTRWISHKGGV